MSRKLILWIYAGLVLYTTAPVLCLLLASLIAYVTGSRLDEGSPHPCVLVWVDIGGILYDLSVMGWFGLVTIPTGIIGLIVFTIVVIISRFRSRRLALAQMMKNEEPNQAIRPTPVHCTPSNQD